jgi:hypothetical protein
MFFNATSLYGACPHQDVCTQSVGCTIRNVMPLHTRSVVASSLYGNVIVTLGKGRETHV